VTTGKFECRVMVVMISKGKDSIPTSILLMLPAYFIRQVNEVQAQLFRPTSFRPTFIGPNVEC
jgi:hypothetical protein